MTLRNRALVPESMRVGQRCKIALGVCKIRCWIFINIETAPHRRLLRRLDRDTTLRMIA
jgi:hypothetical protein